MNSVNNMLWPLQSSDLNVILSPTGEERVDSFGSTVHNPVLFQRR